MVSFDTLLKRAAGWLNTAPDVRVEYAEWDLGPPLATPARPMLEFYLVTRGAVDLQVDGLSARLRAGEAAVVNAHFGNRGEPVGAGLRYACVSLWLPEDAPFPDLKKQAVLATRPVARLQSARRLFRDVSLFRHMPPAALPAVQLKIAVMRLICGLCNDSAGSLTPADADSDSRLQAAFDVLLRRIADPALSVPDMALAANLSTDQLGRLFRREFGVSPMHYVIRLRLSRARDLLRQPDLSVKEVAAAAGFGDPLYFSRVYRRAFGESPGQARAKGR
jgi:AraC-like DNA-binding protein